MLYELTFLCNINLLGHLKVGGKLGQTQTQERYIRILKIRDQPTEDNWFQLKEGPEGEKPREKSSNVDETG